MLTMLLREVTPRDIDILKKLKSFELKLLEIKVNPLAKVIGTNIKQLNLPKEVVLLGVGRANTILFPEDIDEICVNDVFFFLTLNKHEAYLTNLFTKTETKKLI